MIAPAPNLGAPAPRTIPAHTTNRKESDMPGDYDHLPAYDGLRVTLEGERGRKAALAGRDRYEASKSPERRAAEARMRANKIARDREFEASEGQRATTTAAKVTSAPKAAPAKAAKAEPSYGEGLSKGFVTGRDTERARIKAVAAVAIERGQAADALKMLATDADAPSIIAKLKETNLLAEAMRKRFGGAA